MIRRVCISSLFLPVARDARPSRSRLSQMLFILGLGFQRGLSDFRKTRAMSTLAIEGTTKRDIGDVKINTYRF
ncbi:MAG: hypothetical protein ACXWUM_09365, partial [Burkholderiaceae bacterium]